MPNKLFLFINKMWFDSKDLITKKIIRISNLHGFVLPHAGTKYTGNIISHTLRFKPKKRFSKVLILYYPFQDTENVNSKYHHEYFVPMKCIDYYCKKVWNIPNKYTIEGFNIRKSSEAEKNNLINSFTLDDTLIILSVDFSHYIPLQEAIELENCAAHSIMHNHYQHNCISVIDDIKTFKLFNRLLSKRTNNSYLINQNIYFQWVGRTRSPGEEAVGYLSFMIREKIDTNKETPDGFFVTAFDNNMRQRECLGNLNGWNQKLEEDLIKKVIYNARTTSRLTNGAFLDIPVTHYSITYLFKTPTKQFIRGYHGIEKDAFFLSDVFLENTFNNGKWITGEDTQWPNNNIFKMKNTIDKLQDKKRKLSIKKSFNRTVKSKKKNPTINPDKNYQLYTSQVIHKKI